MRDYKKYDTWKIAHELVKEIYIISEHFPKSELFGLTSQIRRAAVSIPTISQKAVEDPQIKNVQDF